MSILLITSSPRGAASHSTRIATEFAEKLVAADPSNTLVVRDLVANPLPHIDADYASGIRLGDVDGDGAGRFVADNAAFQRAALGVGQ
ncbi:NAD(P)H-dependent oxidoreductase, partial [Mesorhizobium sp. M7A.F.Ca.CA.004.12.1.1]|uniref:NAD(P)H-dependent oxidoreductase n=1 Tax=Mesorhizobium sp. M7A.F.Ca.CA.004.12.1.1 TaxID=2496732 RepID=UPI001FDFF151